MGALRREDVVEATVAVMKRAETTLPGWVVGLIKEAARRETSPLARSHLRAILENVAVAGREGLPLCQDTGLPVFHLEVGREADVGFSLEDALADGVRMATMEVPLRPNAVDPMTRSNTGDNTGRGVPVTIYDAVDGDELRITAFPKGAGSENMSLVGMLNPADDPLDFVLEAVAERAANACPPIFLGVGIGGTFDVAASLAKRALLRMPGSSEPETALLERINSLGIGPMGLGGDTTCLGVKLEWACCHTASLPVAVNFQCWANRRASATVGRGEWSTD